jgi:hypothetical protein
MIYRAIEIHERVEEKRSSGTIITARLIIMGYVSLLVKLIVSLPVTRVPISGLKETSTGIVSIAGEASGLSDACHPAEKPATNTEPSVKAGIRIDAPRITRMRQHRILIDVFFTKTCYFIIFIAKLIKEFDNPIKIIEIQ